MSIAALPYAAFLLFLEFGAGMQLVLLIPQFRARTEISPGFLKMGAMMAIFGAAIALWIALSLGVSGDVGGFRLDDRFTGPMRAALAVFTFLCVLYNWFVWRNDEARGRVLGLLSGAAAAVTLLLAAALVQLPTWGYIGALLSLVAGTLALGAVSLGMTLGHWYLVTPRLPERPLNQLTLLLLAALVVQSVIVAANIFIPVREIPVGPDTPDVSLGQNLWFWLRIGVGLAFPLALAFMAWQSSVVRAMMSATGLLYIAMGSVLAGEVLARALLFTTARPL